MARRILFVIGGRILRIGVVNRAAKIPSTKSATQKFTVSTGKGTIEASRGSAHLVADDGTILAGEIDIMGQPWTGSTWAPKSTAGTAWTNGTWNANIWTGSQFNTDLTVDGVTWSGRTWRSETWSGRTWRADLWAGRTWRTELWSGRTWRSDGWY